MAKRNIYRQAALDRLASPSAQDTHAKLVGRPAWLILLTFVAAIAGASVWAFSVRLPVTVTAEGILIDRAGLVEISADRVGRLETLDLAPGKIVDAGTIVAQMSQSELRRSLETAQAKLDDAKERHARFVRFFEEQKRREVSSDAARETNILNAISALKDRVNLLDDRVESTKVLLEKQIVRQDRLIEVQVAASDARERLAVLEEEYLRLKLASDERESERTIALLDESLNVEEQERQVARIAAQLEDQQFIRATHTGRVVEVKVNSGDVIALGDALATIAPIDENGGLEAVFYAPPGDGKLIEVGMSAEVSPTGVEREIYGFIVAEVTSVAPLPATREGMRRTLQNDQLVTQLSAGGAPIEVRLKLEPNAATPTGLNWSSSDGPQRGVGAGALVRGKVVVDMVPVADIILPGFSRFISGS